MEDWQLGIGEAPQLGGHCELQRSAFEWMSEVRCRTLPQFARRMGTADFPDKAV